MIKAGAGRFLTALILTSITFSSTAAQSKSTQPAATDEPEQIQSINQIVKFDHKPLEAKAFAPVREVARLRKALEPQLDTDEPTLVIPPAPVIVKKTTSTTITIPVDRASLGADSKYVERPAVSSSISVGSDFGYRRDPFTRRAKFHSGVDIKARRGDPIGASQAGTVQFAGWYHGYGNMVIVNHGGGVATHYAHLTSFDVGVGVRVERGTIVGRAGSTGRATSPHLHYEVRLDGNAMDPFQPLALDPSSGYFKQSRPTVEAGRGDVSAASTQRAN